MKEKTKDAWSKLTDPGQHNLKQFAYLVTGIPDQKAHKNAIKYFKSKGQYDPIQDVLLCEHPEKIHQIKQIHASLVTSDHPLVFRTSGFILKCPAENILDIQTRDTCTHIFPEKQPKFDLTFTPNELIRCTSAHNHNQIKLCGETQFGRVEVIGFFCDLEDQKNIVILKSKTSQLPLVRHKWIMGVETIEDFLFFSNQIPSQQLPEKPATTAGSDFGFKHGFLTRNIQASTKESTIPKHVVTTNNREKVQTTMYCGLRPGFFDVKQEKVSAKPEAPPKKQLETKETTDYCGFKSGFLG